MVICMCIYIYIYIHIYLCINLCIFCWLGLKCASKVCLQLKPDKCMETHFRWQKLKTCWNSRRFHKLLLINDTLRHDYTDTYSILVQYICICVYRVLSCNSQLVLPVSSAASSSAAAVTQFVAHFWVRLNDLLRECALYVWVCRCSGECAGVKTCVCLQVWVSVSGSRVCFYYRQFVKLVFAPRWHFDDYRKMR